MINEHPAFPRILVAMRMGVRLAHAWKGTIFRSAPPRWPAGRNMLSGLGSMKSGARFNAPGAFPAVYGSTTPELAMMESLAYQRRAGVPVEYAMPLVFKAISVEVDCLLDLTDAAVLSAIGVSSGDITADKWWIARGRGDEALTQAIGRCRPYV
jgi:RES domain-containing protein